MYAQLKLLEQQVQIPQIVLSEMFRILCNTQRHFLNEMMSIIEGHYDSDQKLENSDTQIPVNASEQSTISFVRTRNDELSCIERSQIMELTNVINLRRSHVVIFDLLVELQGGSDYQGFDLLHAIKPVRSIERKGRFFFFSIPEKINSSKVDLNWSIEQLKQQNNLEFSEYLVQISNLQLCFEKKIQSITSSSGFCLERAMHLKRLRSEYLRDYCEIDNSIKKSNPSNEFMSISVYSPCFSSNSLHLSTLIHSSAFLYLLGADEESISRIVLQKGRLDVFSNESRFVIQKILMNYLLKGEVKNQINDFEITTYDNINIRCPMKYQIVEFTYPSHLQFNSQIPIADISIFISLLVDPFQLRKMSGIRKNIGKHAENQLQLFISYDADFEYSMQSEIFLQKFYSRQLEEIHAQAKDVEKKNAELYAKTCKYKEIK